MIPTSVILTALAIISGTSEPPLLDIALGQHKDEIMEKVQNLKGSRIAQVRETIDILSCYNLEIQKGDLIIASNSESDGVSYSTDPPDDQILPC